jgi:uncharacterized protein YggT (Ycf19 family)
MFSLLQSWSYPVLNTLLIVMAWLLLARLLLSIFLSANNALWRVVAIITDPVVKGVRFCTPSGVPLPLVVVAAMFWLVLLRLAVFMLLSRYGLLPPVGGTS